MSATPYVARRPSRSEFHPVRDLRYHARVWGDPSTTSAERPLLVMVHGWMDVGASFQFIVDELEATALAGRAIVAPDWRGFGHTESAAQDCYWFPDYLGDLDALLDAFAPGRPVDLLGHSMGGNVVMSYGGVRPGRVRRLINLEGFGLPRAEPRQAPRRLLQWLDELKTPHVLRDYDSVDGVAARLEKNNPRLSADKAAWLAPHWSAQRADGRWHILGDPAHKRLNPTLYHVDEILEAWKLITAPLLWVEGDNTDIAKWWGHRYSKEEFHQRLAVVPAVRRERLADCGHMLHHEQPRALAALLAEFLGG